MPTIHDLWPDKWLKAHHLQGKRPTVTIAEVTVETLYSPRTRKEEPRLIISFYRKTLRLIVNKTQAQALAAITGSDDYTTWIAHQVVLSAGRTPSGADTIVISPTPDPPPAFCGGAIDAAITAAHGEEPAGNSDPPPPLGNPAPDDALGSEDRSLPNGQEQT